MDYEWRRKLPYLEQNFVKDIGWVDDYWNEYERHYRDDLGVFDWESYDDVNRSRLLFILHELLDDKPNHPVWKLVKDYDELLENLFIMSEGWDEEESIASTKADIMPGAVKIAQAIWALEGLAGYSEFDQFGNLPLDAL